MNVKKGKWLFVALALAMILAMVPALAGAVNDNIEAELAVEELGPDGIIYIGSDTETKGDWTGIDNPVSSPIGRYGSCAYILPDPPRNRVEEVVGDFHAPVGFSIDEPDTYSLLSQSPWDWTSSQVLGLENYKAESPYWDEFWTADGMEDFDYTLSGTYMELDSSRSLLDEDGLYTRAACWFAGSAGSPDELDIELDVPEGEHMLSLYLIDWDDVGREETVTVEVSTEEESESVDSFYDGVYLNFFVNLPDDGQVNINVVKDNGANAVVSGLFLSDTDETAANTGEAEVRSLTSDTTTQGNWVGTYGDIGWVLSAFDVPETRERYDWDSDYDRSDGIDYSVTGTQFAWNAETAFVDAIQYPVFEWAWASATDTRPSDLRAAYYPIKEQWRPAVWDDGNERCKPKHGYFDFNLHFPEGRYMLSLYTYDWERQRSSQEYQLFNADDMETVLASSVVEGEAFNEGVYESFVLEAGEGGRDMVVRIYNDQGKPTNINVLLQGVFVDCLAVPPTYEICGYKYLDGEPAAGWVMELEVEVDGVFQPYKVDGEQLTATTGADGQYCFTDLPEGTYRITEVLKPGFTQIFPDPEGENEGAHIVTLPEADTEMHATDWAAGEPLWVEMHPYYGEDHGRRLWPGNALGEFNAEQGVVDLNDKFFAVAAREWVNYTFDDVFCNVVGEPDIEFVEVTWGSWHNEAVLVYLTDAFVWDEGKIVPYEGDDDGYGYYAGIAWNKIGILGLTDVEMNDRAQHYADAMDIIRSFEANEFEQVGDFGITKFHLPDEVVFASGITLVDITHDIYDTVDDYIGPYAYPSGNLYGYPKTYEENFMGWSGDGYDVFMDKSGQITANRNDDAGNTDGYDLDGIRVYRCVSYDFYNRDDRQEVCETAWAYGGDEEGAEVEGVKHNLGVKIDGVENPSNAWGWTNWFDGDALVMDLYAGAAQNDTTKGKLVGTVTVECDNGTVTVTYEVKDGYWISEAHLWVGDTELPVVRRGRTETPTSAPGQFTYSFSTEATDVGEWIFDDLDYACEFWVAAHAVVCWYE